MDGTEPGDRTDADKCDLTSCGIPSKWVEEATAGELLAPGTQAPEFTLYATPDETCSLRDFRGQPVVLVFYPADWSPVCGDQLALYNEFLPLFDRYDAQLLALSVDGVWSHDAFTDDRNLDIPLLADFEPKGAVARAYGAYRDDDGTSERALFVVDSAGIVQWSYVSPVGVNPGADGILNALDDLVADDGAGEVGA